MPWLTRQRKTTALNKVGPNEWALARDIIYHSPVSGFVYEIKEGYLTDLASIPWFYRWRFKPDGPWWDESILHDILYGAEFHSRGTCDEVFKHALLNDSKVGGFRARVFYAAVRLGGGAVWSKHTGHTVSYAREYLNPVPADSYFQ